ncbi:MAG: DUF1883 domain-containing protein [Defluviitaleaceae bacterium]|nr:DUF1883 domain-containing protein [Defluviitaleaceae bacterium]
MNFTHYDLGGLGKGRTVEVALQGNAANVYLMDHDNFERYNQARSFQALGGLVTFSPIRLQTIASAHWHIVIDMPKGQGMVKTAVRIRDSQPPNISTNLAKFKPSEEQKRSVANSKTSNAPPIPETKQEPKPELKTVTQPPKLEQISCPKCGILTVRGKFCTECGSPMEKICPGCYIINTLENKYCYECGYRLS